MRSYSLISQILAKSKKKCEEKPKAVAEFIKKLNIATQEAEQKFQENYFSEIDTFLAKRSNNYKDALPILILIERNKNTVLGALLIQHVAFPILCMSYPIHLPVEVLRKEMIRNPGIACNIEQFYKYKEGCRPAFIKEVKAQLNTGITALADKINYLSYMKTILSNVNTFLGFFPTPLIDIMTEYADEDMLPRHDLILLSGSIDEVKLHEVKLAAKTSGVPILSRESIEVLGKVSETFSIYGDPNGNGNWKNTIICTCPDAATFSFLNQLPFDEKILKKEDIRFTNDLMEILRVGHIPSIDYTAPTLRC